MNNLKRKLALIITMVMMCTVLASCGGDDGSTSTSGGTESSDSSSSSGGTESSDSSSSSGGTESSDSSSSSSSKDEDAKIREDEYVLRSAQSLAQADYLLTNATNDVEYFITVDSDEKIYIASQDKASKHNWKTASDLYSEAMDDGRVKLIVGDGGKILYAGIVESDLQKKEKLDSDENALSSAIALAQADYLLLNRSNDVEYFITVDSDGDVSIASSDDARFHHWIPKSDLYLEAMDDGRIKLVIGDGGQTIYAGIVD